MMINWEKSEYLLSVPSILPHVQGGEGGGGSTWLWYAWAQYLMKFNDDVNIDYDRRKVSIHDDIVQVNIEGHRLRGKQLQIGWAWSE